MLPFVNASAEAENEYLSDGITDELINALTKLPGVRVASRTSVFALKGKPLDVRAIGALLDSAYVLEGTVRRSGTQLRITAQLSSTDDGRLLWSQRYARANRDAMMDAVLRSLFSFIGKGAEVSRVNCHHNFTEMEHHSGENVDPSDLVREEVELHAEHQRGHSGQPPEHDARESQREQHTHGQPHPMKLGPAATRGKDFRARGR